MVIYKTTNLLNGKSYIGKDCKNRNWYLGSGIALKSAIKKYGKDNFKKEIIDYCCDKEHLSFMECYWIKRLKTICPNGYNIAKGGDGGDLITNHPDRDAIINKMRNRVTWMKGKTHTPEAKDKNRLKHLGRIPWNKKEREKRVCEGCGKAYLTIRDSQKYCSYSCRGLGKIPWNKGLKYKITKEYNDRQINFL